MKNLNTSSLTNSINSLKNWVIRYRIVLFIVVVSAVFGFLMFRITQMSTMEPTVQQKEEALQSLKKVKINQEAIDKLTLLNDQGIQIDTLFDPGRYDPFND